VVTDQGMQKHVYLSLGSNVGDRVNHLREAITRLESVSRVVSVSSFYETEPIEVTNQPWFLNCAIEVETTKMPKQFMAAVLGIEQELGRQRTRHKGPRSIDIDILLFGNTILDSPELTIPHPAMQERRFVLEPLAEIAPDARHPVFKKTVREMLDALAAGQAVGKFRASDAGKEPITNQ
jgi:2-amino-4-hydroxy-6-hydroxymethyldihydropteridine diphosphokinase